MAALAAASHELFPPASLQAFRPILLNRGNMEHITTLSLFLEPANGCDAGKIDPYALGPMLQSILMSHADEEYAKQLHATGFNPYSQYCSKDSNGNLVWRINTLTDDAEYRLLEPARKIESFTLRNISASFAIAKQVSETKSVSCLLEKLHGDTDARYRIHFAAPTAFKSKNRYVFMPDVRLIFQNLLMRYNQVYAGNSDIDAETVEYIAEHTDIASYSLRSHYFPRTMGRQDRIPAFIGIITLRVTGPQSLRGLVSMLLAFGEVAGVGIKTSMGMGGMRLLPVGQKPNTMRQGGAIGQ